MGSGKGNIKPFVETRKLANKPEPTPEITNSLSIDVTIPDDVTDIDGLKRFMRKVLHDNNHHYIDLCKANGICDRTAKTFDDLKLRYTQLVNFTN